MKFAKLISVFGALAIALVWTGCAKHRDIEKLDDPDGKWLLKQDLLGHGSRTTWIYKVTVTKTTPGAGFTFVGMESDARVGHFEFTEKALKLYDDNVPANERASGTAAKKLLNEWKITHHDKRLQEVDGKTTNKEEEDTKKKWSEKRFVKFSPESPRITESAQMPYPFAFAEADGWRQKSASLVKDSFELSKDYFTFEAEQTWEVGALQNSNLRQVRRTNNLYTIHLRYSFMKLGNSSYKPLVYAKGEKDPRRLRYFNTKREYATNAVGVNNHQVAFLMDRYDPNKTHYYYFTKNTPDKYKRFYTHPEYGIFTRINKLFQTKGLRIRFEAKENNWTPNGPGPEKKIGDIRYSFINYIQEPDPEAPLGYGPHVTNPFTGEIISGTAHVWAGYVHQIMHRLTLHHNRSNPTAQQSYANSSLFTQMRDILGGGSPETWVGRNNPAEGYTRADHKNHWGQAFWKILPKVTFGYPGYADFTFFPTNSPLVYRGPQNQPTAFTGGGTGEPRLTAGFGPSHGTFGSPLGGFGAANNTTNVTSVNSWNTTQATDAVLDPRVQQRLFALREPYERNLRPMIQQELQRQARLRINPKHHVIYPVEEAVAGANRVSLEGKSLQEALDTIMYRVSIHEFGHTINLRHNFMGSVDHKHFVPERKQGTKVLVRGTTSTVMEYMDYKDQIHAPWDWEAYDRKAILYAYSDGKQKDDQDFLQCTDNHRNINALCNHWDTGRSASEVIMSLMKRYDNYYYLINQRLGRTYWDTSSYFSRIFNILYDVKRFHQLWRSALSSTDIERHLIAVGYSNADDIRVYKNDIEKDLKLAIKLSAAFYNAVVSQRNSDRDYRHQYDVNTGELNRVGIGLDKQIAMLFLLGDDGFMYNPNRQMYYASYTAFLEDSYFKETFEKVWENSLTVRPQMTPGFIQYARALYASAAANFATLSDTSLIDRIRVVRLRPAEVKTRYNVDVDAFGRDEDIKVFNGDNPLPRGDRLFERDETVGMVKYRDGYVYMVSQDRSPYAFSVIRQSLLEDRASGFSYEEAKRDIVEFWTLYRQALGLPLSY